MNLQNKMSSCACQVHGVSFDAISSIVFLKVLNKFQMICMNVFEALLERKVRFENLEVLSFVNSANKP